MLYSHVRSEFKLPVPLAVMSLALGLVDLLSKYQALVPTIIIYAVLMVLTLQFYPQATCVHVYTMQGAMGQHYTLAFSVLCLVLMYGLSEVCHSLGI